MSKRRARGDGGLHWDARRQRWIAAATVGYRPDGKRIIKRGSGKTKTEAKAKLKEIIRDYEDGLAIAPTNYTVGDAVTYWLSYGLKGRSASTVQMYTTFARKHVIAALGARKLRDLSVEDVDAWLAKKSDELSTRSLKLIHGILNRAVKSAMRRDKVKRNVLISLKFPRGRTGRPQGLHLCAGSRRPRRDSHGLAAQRAYRGHAERPRPRIGRRGLDTRLATHAPAS